MIYVGVESTDQSLTLLLRTALALQCTEAQGVWVGMWENAFDGLSHEVPTNLVT